MWFYLVLTAIIVISAIGIAATVVGKFPQVSLIDAESLPQEREARKKREIIRGRVGRRMGAAAKQLGIWLAPAFAWLGRKFHLAHEAIAKLDKQFWSRAAAKRKVVVKPVDPPAAALTAVAEAERLAGEGKSDEAEKRLIEAISLDQKCVSAYRGLGEIYMNSKNHSQARETYQYLTKLSIRECCGPGSDGRRGKNRNGTRGHAAPAAVQTQIAKDHVALAEACRALGQVPACRSALEVAVAHEPANPKHLDLLLEACIMDGDKEMAARVLEALKEVNPDNQKLAKMEERIAGMKVGEKAAA